VIAWLGLALLLLPLVLRPVLALVYGRRIGEKVLAAQQPVLHLAPTSASAALRPDAIESLARRLQMEGFADAGWFTADGMPEIALRMLAHEPEGWLAILYEHRRARAPWVEINARFPDGSRLAFSDQAATGLAPLPGVEHHHMAGASPEAMLRAARAALAKRDMTPNTVSASTAARIFEEGYARLVELRRQQGISRAEVAAIAMRGPRVKRGKVA
jgi:hypothetical protein